jgi:hypothetical protein
MDCELDRRNHGISSPSPSSTFGMPYDDMEESSSMAASSVTTQSDPGPHLNADRCQVRILTMCKESSSTLHQIACHNSHVDHHLPNTDARIHLPTTKLHPSTHRAPSPATSPSPFPVVLCGQCGVEFTGRYRRGNLRRHVKYAHNGAKAFQCWVEGCNKDFRRNDAWLKHARKHHPELSIAPASTKQGTTVTSVHLDHRHWPESLTAAAATISETVAGHYEAPPQEDAEIATGVEALLHTARMVYTTLRHELGVRNYFHYMAGYFARWEAVVEQLRRQRQVP